MQQSDTIKLQLNTIRPQTEFRLQSSCTQAAILPQAESDNNRTTQLHYNWAAIKVQLGRKLNQATIRPLEPENKVFALELPLARCNWHRAGTEAVSTISRYT